MYSLAYMLYVIDAIDVSLLIVCFIHIWVDAVCRQLAQLIAVTK
jgi:hypothetical protein